MCTTQTPCETAITTPTTQGKMPLRTDKMGTAAAAAAAAPQRDTVSDEDRAFLRRIEEHPPAVVDSAFVREFADRLACYPDEIAAFVGVFAVLLQRNRELAADNEQLIAAIAQLKRMTMRLPQ